MDQISVPRNQKQATECDKGCCCTQHCGTIKVQQRAGKHRQDEIKRTIGERLGKVMALACDLPGDPGFLGAALHRFESRLQYIDRKHLPAFLRKQDRIISAPAAKVYGASGRPARDKAFQRGSRPAVAVSGHPGPMAIPEDFGCVAVAYGRRHMVFLPCLRRLSSPRSAKRIVG